MVEVANLPADPSRVVFCRIVFHPPLFYGVDGIWRPAVSDSFPACTCCQSTNFESSCLCGQTKPICQPTIVATHAEGTKDSQSLCNSKSQLHVSSFAGSVSPELGLLYRFHQFFLSSQVLTIYCYFHVNCSFELPKCMPQSNPFA